MGTAVYAIEVIGSDDVIPLSFFTSRIEGDDLKIIVQESYLEYRGQRRNHKRPKRFHVVRRDNKTIRKILFALLPVVGTMGVEVIRISSEPGVQKIRYSHRKQTDHYSKH